MKHLASAFAALVAIAAATPALAVDAVVCGDSVATTGNAGYLACQGPTDGNIAPNQTNTATFDGVTYSLVGKTDDADSGPFTIDMAGATSGVLTFDAVQKGRFVLGLKGGPDYSLYLFDGGSAGIMQLSFDTLGITKGNGRPGPGLSHAALFTAAVPEPETYALMLAGLAGVAFMARRRRAA